MPITVHVTVAYYRSQIENLLETMYLYEPIKSCLIIVPSAPKGMLRIDQAEAYVARAEWMVLKHPDCPNSIRHLIFRTMGLIHEAHSNYEDAREAYATDVSRSAVAENRYYGSD